MRPYTTINRSRPKPSDPYHVVPIPPRSVVRESSSGRGASTADIGRIFRIGYYGQVDGLDCIWLVNEAGEYEQTVDHQYLFDHYDILTVSEERSLYGKDRPKIPPIRHAKKKRGRGRNSEGKNRKFS